MRVQTRSWYWLILLAVISVFPAISHAQDVVVPFQTQIVLSDPCAVFNAPTDDPTITRIVYGENIDFDLQGTIQAILVTDSDGHVNLKFQINTHGAGIGEKSEIKYQFNSKVLVKANTNGADPYAPGYVFNGKFLLNARIIGQGNDGSDGSITQGAQNNALLNFYINVKYSQDGIQAFTSDFTLQCVASPWTNLMTQTQGSQKTPVGRGFGDPWNKYSWAMKDFNGGMIVGTKNAHYSIAELLNPTSNTDAVNYCNANSPVPQLYRPLACLEMFEPGIGADTNYAQIWRFDYKKKTWSDVYDDQDSTNDHDPRSQGFRVMEVYNNKLYVGSDLGSFIAGVQLTNGNTGPWYFPGSRLLMSSDGKTFSEVPCPLTDMSTPQTEQSPCTYATAGDLTTLDVNISFRSLASFDGKLYLGTFNAVGGELWSYDDNGDIWHRVKKFDGNNDTDYAFAVTELKVYDDELYIGVGTAPGNEYLYKYDGNNTDTVVPVTGTDKPALSDYSIGVLKLFVSSRNNLYIGIVDFLNGFTLLQYQYDPIADQGHFTTVTNNGFFNANNAYAWSMAEVNGRVFVGTFNDNFISTLPRGSAELWYSDDEVNWQEMALPLDWGLWNYGIRDMEVGNKQLFLGSASNMVAPDLISTPIPLSPGTEVWTIRNTAVAPTGKSGKNKN